MVKWCIQPWYQSPNFARMWCSILCWSKTENPQNMLWLTLKSSRDLIVTECLPEQTVWHQSKGTSEVQIYHTEAFCPCYLHFMPNHVNMFQTSKNSWDSCFLHRYIYQAICLQMGDQTPCYHTKEDLSIHQIDRSEETYGHGILLLRNENTTCLPATSSELFHFPRQSP